MSDCSLRSRGSRFEAAAFLSHSQTKSMSARSFVQDSGARSWALGIRRRRRRAEEKHLRSLPLRAAARDSRRSQRVFLHCSRIALCLIARSARCDVRWVAAVFVGSGETETVVGARFPTLAAHQNQWAQRGSVSRLMVLARRSARVSGFFPSSIHRAYSLRWVKGNWSYAALAAGFSASAAVSSAGSTTTRS
jgi:hypothetical protein